MALLPLNTFKTKTTSLRSGTYDKSKCARDTALIIDSIAFDLLYDGYTQSRFAGFQYWAQAAVKIPGEIVQTIAALDRAKEISIQIVRNETVTPTSGNAETQIKDLGNPGSVASTLRIAEEYDVITNIIKNGTAGTTDAIVSNGDVTTDSGLLNAINLLTLNKTFIQEEVVAYIINKYQNPQFTFDHTKCIRDTKLIVDSLAFDVLFDGSSQSEFAGLKYWTKNSEPVLVDETEQTLAAINHARDIAKQVVRNTIITPTTGNLIDQFINIEKPGSRDSVDIIDTNFTVITDIANGIVIDPALTNNIVSNGPRSTRSGILNSYDLLQKNKRFIQDEVIAWITEQVANAIDTSADIWYGFTYDQDKYEQNIEYVVDSVSFDLLYGGNRQSTQAGVYLYYYDFNGAASELPFEEQSPTINAFTYLKVLMASVVEAKQISFTYQSTYEQVFNLPGGSPTEGAVIASNIDIINNIIENGPSLVSERSAISLIPVDTIPKKNAFDLILANKDFLAAEVVAYIDYITDFPEDSSVSFSENQQDLCKRDLGYIIDCVNFDIKHTGNRQATQAGVYYYDNSSTVSVIEIEKTETKAAYNYLNTLINAVIDGKPFPDPTTTPTQTVVSRKRLAYPAQPNIGAPASDEATAARERLDLIIDIIDKGPVASEKLAELPAEEQVAKPISPDRLTAPNIVKAYELLIANKSFFVAEMLGYMDTNQIAKNIKVYTSPPGVTSIILMAQVANVTDHEIKITFAHYRNLVVTADPSTENGYQAENTTTELAKDFVIPPNDAASLLNGKMIIESFDSIIAYASENNGLKLTLSILETATT